MPAPASEICLMSFNTYGEPTTLATNSGVVLSAPCGGVADSTMLNVIQSICRRGERLIVREDCAGLGTIQKSMASLQRQQLCQFTMGFTSESDDSLLPCSLMQTLVLLQMILWRVLWYYHGCMCMFVVSFASLTAETDSKAVDATSVVNHRKPCSNVCVIVVHYLLFLRRLRGLWILFVSRNCFNS